MARLSVRRRGHSLPGSALLLVLASFVLATPQKSDRVNEAITAHSALTLDAAVAPLKKYIVQYATSSDCSGDLEAVQKDFISFTRLYQSKDFPRDVAKNYSAVPIMFYISAIVLVFWILATLIFCILRCCLRKTGCCSPVLYGPKEKRRRNEILCLVVYLVALGLFTVALILMVISFCLYPKLGKDLDKGMVQPLWAYASALPSKVSKLSDSMDDSIKSTVNTIASGLNLQDVGSQVGKYLDAKLPKIEIELKGFYTSAKEYLDGSVPAELYQYLGEFEEKQDDIEKFMGGSKGLDDTIKQLKDNKSTIETVFDIDKLLDKGFDLIKEKIFNALKGEDDDSTTEGSSITIREDDSGSDLPINLIDILNIDGMIDIFKSCVLNHFQTDDEAPLYCILSKVNSFLNTEELTNQLVTMLDEPLEDIKKEMKTFADDIDKNYISKAKNYVSLVGRFLNGTLENPIKEIMNLINGVSSDGSDSSGSSESESPIPEKYMNMINFALKSSLAITVLVAILIIVLNYILPISLALCLRKRNRKQGKCQCKAWLKCSTCCCSCGLPITFIIITALGIALAIVHYVMLAAVLNTDSSNLEVKQVTLKNGDIKEVPAPIGEKFNECVLRNYGSKQYIFEKFVLGNGDSSSNNESNTGTYEDDSSALDEIGTKALNQLVSLAGEFIPSVLLCRGSNNFKEPKDKPSTDADWDEYYMKKYGTFFSALKLDTVIDTMVNEIIDTPTIATLMEELTGMEVSSDADPIDPLLKPLDKQIDAFLNDTIGDLASEFKNGFTFDNFDFSGLEGMISEYAEVTNLFDTTKDTDFEFKLVGNMVGVGDAICEKKNDINTAFTTSPDSFDANYKEDMTELLKGCGDDNKWAGIKEGDNQVYVKFKHHNFKTFLVDTKEKLPDNQLGTFNNLKGKVDEFLKYFEDEDYSKIIDITNRVIGVLYKAIGTIQKVIAEISELVTKITDNPENYYTKYENIEYLKGGKTDFTDGLVKSLQVSAKKIGTDLAKTDVNSFAGLMSCYPIAVSTNTVAGTVNTLSHIYTLSTLSLCFIIFGCLVMMIAANMGPIVYNEKYKYKCCCCCHTSAWKKKSKEERRRLKRGGEPTIAAHVVLYKNDVENPEQTSSDTTDKPDNGKSSNSEKKTPDLGDETEGNIGGKVEYPSVPSEEGDNGHGAKNPGNNPEFSSSRPIQVSEETTLNTTNDNNHYGNPYEGFNPYDDRELSSAGGGFPINDDEYQL